ncbi:potassium transporter [Porphyromonas macacae]|uniref:Potassium transporter n=1 Tax=Porphyromonas macacae TaxID=28115 RepID=A0A0A2E7N7_9PORP|nr:TrkH family potassium uptake protein [Porphyromonas macacae]KGN74866.1 potassium transporter [Porphyromonas macacae]
MSRINCKFISRIVGMMCIIEGVVLLFCLLVSLIYRENIFPILISSLVFATIGFVFFLPSKNYREKKIGSREGMLTVTLTWLILSLIGTLPFLLSQSTNNFIDAFFETISGFTTTGATIFTEVENLPKGILLWRSITQWQGGVGIVVFSIALIPLIGGGASSLFNAETTGITHDRFLPRITQVAKRIFTIYLFLTLLLFILLLIGPMELYDAICHSLTCISTGGFSTKNNSIGSYNSPYLEYIVSIFMFIGSLSLALLYFAILRKQPQKLLRDEESRWYAGILGVCVIITMSWLIYHNEYPSIESNFRHALFQVTSLFSSTGYLTADIGSWGAFFGILAVSMMAVNGCAGSTSGGLKMGRFLILLKNLNNEFHKRVSPNQVVPVKVNGHTLAVSTVHQVLAFTFLYFFLILTGAMLLMLMNDHSFIEGISVATSAISNSGPALGSFVNNFEHAGFFTKIIMCFLMLAGRLEVFTVITILTPTFWRK